jgi:hypothetical protein
MGLTDLKKSSSTKKRILAPVAIVAVLACALFLIMHSVQRKMEDRFNLLLSKIKEGMTYSEAELIIGENPDRILTEKKDVEEWGTVKDTKITQECTLHMFSCTSVIPHRYILIYEDKKNHTVRHVAWKYM